MGALMDKSVCHDSDPKDNSRLEELCRYKLDLFSHPNQHLTESAGMGFSHQ